MELVLKALVALVLISCLSCFAIVGFAQSDSDVNEFNVTTKKIRGPSSAEANSGSATQAVTIVKPSSKAKFTTGSIDFVWNLQSEFQGRKATIILQNIETGENTTHSTLDTNLSIDIAPGKYRWQITLANTTGETRWRSIEVINDIALKSIPSFDIENPNSNYEAKITHDEVRKEQSSDKKLSEYKKQKLEAEKQARDLEKQVKAAQMQAQKAMKFANDEQAHLADLKQQKIKAEKLEKQRLAKLEADRKAAKLKEKKLIALNEKRTQLARAKVERAQKLFRSLVQEVKSARTAWELAIKDSNVKAELYREASLKIKGTPKSGDSPTSERIPASETSEEELAPQ